MRNEREQLFHYQLSFLWFTEAVGFTRKESYVCIDLD